MNFDDLEQTITFLRDEIQINNDLTFEEFKEGLL